MEMKINKKNAAEQPHGYWDDGGWKVHYYKGMCIGYYYESYRYQCHFLNNKEIGCEQFIHTQYFYKTPGKIFGEMIQWK